MKSVLGRDDRHYRNIGITTEVKSWEDGLRSTDGKGVFEWWYFDCENEDGSKVVVVFSKNNKRDFKGITGPTASLQVTFADGEKLDIEITDGVGAPFRAAKDKCDVLIQDSYFREVNGSYEIYFKAENVEYNCTLKPIVPMWRPGTGYSYFGDDESLFMAWIVAVPRGEVTSMLKVGDKTMTLNGEGYHDHNWGNAPMPRIIDHWYWGRANFSGYTIIVSDVVAAKKYGYTRMPLIMIAKGNQIIADDESKTLVERENEVVHPHTGKFFHNTVRFTQKLDSGEVIVIEFNRSKDMSASFLLDMPGITKLQKFVAKMVLGLNPTYVRCFGEVSLTVKKDCLEESVSMEGIWEQMFFGKNRKWLITNP